MPAPYGKFNDATKRRLLEALAMNPHYAPAAHYAGIAPSTLRDWMGRGRRYQHWLETGGDGDMMAERLWRKASVLFDAGQKQAAYKILADLDFRSDRQPDLPYYELLLQIQEARAKVEVALSGVVRRAAFGVTDEQGNTLVEPDWKAALAMLRSTFPERWSERRLVESDVDVIDEDEILARKQEQAHSLLEQARERRNGGSG